jgi:hypothetical protein
MKQTIIKLAGIVVISYIERIKDEELKVKVKQLYNSVESIVIDLLNKSDELKIKQKLNELQSNINRQHTIDSEAVN